MRVERRRSRLAAVVAVVLAAAATVMATGAVAGAKAPSDALRAGVGTADLTPDVGRNMDGYVRPDIFVKGVATRVKARALILQRGSRKLALVSLDLRGVTGGFRSGVAARVADLGLTTDTIFMSATHTHSGPDFALNTFSTASTLSGDPGASLEAFIVAQIAKAVRQANASLRPAALGWASVEVADSNESRSVEAHLANHGIDSPPHTKTPADDPLGPLHTVERTLHLLRVDAVNDDGKRTPMGVWFRFSSHNTAIPPSNTVFAGDWSVVAQWYFEKGLAAEGHPGVVSSFANGNEGDLVTPSVSYNGYADADAEAKKIARGMRIAWGQAEKALTTEPILETRTAVICFCGQQVEGGQISSQAFWGLAILGGGQNGPEPFYQLYTEGIRRPSALADPVWGRKILLTPVPYATVMPVRQFRIADAIISGIPGEPTTEMVRRVQAGMAASGAVAKNGINRTVVVGLAEDFVGYFTTPEEYDQQHYEGAHTTYGKWSSNLIIATHRDLADRLMHGKPNPEPAGTLSTSSVGESPVLTGDGGSPGAISEQPAERVARMQVVTMKWTGGAFGKDRPLETAFITLERKGSAVPVGGGASALGGQGAKLPATGAGGRAAGMLALGAAASLGVLVRRRRGVVKSVGTLVLVGALACLVCVGLPGSVGRATADEAWHQITSDLEPGFEWRFDDASSTYSLEYDVPPDLGAGTYRLRIHSARYTLESRLFEIVASDGLTVRGVMANRSGGKTTLKFQAANPVPDPETSMWDRDRIPTGGALKFSVAGKDGTAAYDKATQTWVAEVAGDATAGEVAVAEHGLRDGWGNTSGAAKTLKVGQIEELKWPPVMPMGGHCIPGPAGVGCFFPTTVFPWPPGPNPLPIWGF